MKVLTNEDRETMIWLAANGLLADHAENVTRVTGAEMKNNKRFGRSAFADDMAAEACLGLVERGLARMNLGYQESKWTQDMINEW
jgi:hypothetical protein